MKYFILINMKTLMEQTILQKITTEHNFIQEEIENMNKPLDTEQIQSEANPSATKGNSFIFFNRQILNYQAFKKQKISTLYEIFQTTEKIRKTA